MTTKKWRDQYAGTCFFFFSFILLTDLFILMKKLMQMEEEEILISVLMAIEVRDGYNHYKQSIRNPEIKFTRSFCCCSSQDCGQ